jgi:hypothetical protein
MIVILVPIAVYIVSALLLFLETSLVTSALHHLQGLPNTAGRRIAMGLLLMPLVLMPLVPVVFLFTLDFKGKATPQGYVYMTLIWLGGIIAALPSYWYLTHRSRKKKDS